RSLVTPTYKVGLALAMIYTAKIFSLTQPVYQKDSGQAGMTSKQNWDNHSISHRPIKKPDAP
ncbi:MAG: hypothetical protein M1497_03955, partial [Nitrospirae bacterium]|nr:hypothetical protein [Nitrospirota bacterium]